MARTKLVPDVIAPGLKVLFCGINPGLYSAAIGHHFGRPGNRFWPTLWRAGFTDPLLTPYQGRRLLAYRLGLPNNGPHGNRAPPRLSPRRTVPRGARPPP